MASVKLQLIRTLDHAIPAECRANTARLVDMFVSTGQLDALLQHVQFCRVLKLRNKIYAFDQLILLAVLAQRWPEQNIDVQVLPVRDEEQLHASIISHLALNGIASLNATHVPDFDRAARRSASNSLFPIARWAQILGKHRSTLYPKRAKSTNSALPKIEISNELKRIPMPNSSGFPT